MADLVAAFKAWKAGRMADGPDYSGYNPNIGPSSRQPSMKTPTMAGKAPSGLQAAFQQWRASRRPQVAPMPVYAPGAGPGDTPRIMSGGAKSGRHLIADAALTLQGGIQKGIDKFVDFAGVDPDRFGGRRLNEYVKRQESGIVNFPNPRTPAEEAYVKNYNTKEVFGQPVGPNFGPFAAKVGNLMSMGAEYFGVGTRFALGAVAAVARPEDRVPGATSYGEAILPAAMAEAQGFASLGQQTINLMTLISGSAVRSVVGGEDIDPLDIIKEINAVGPNDPRRKMFEGMTGEKLTPDSYMRSLVETIRTPALGYFGGHMASKAVGTLGKLGIRGAEVGGGLMRENNRLMREQATENRANMRKYLDPDERKWSPREVVEATHLADAEIKLKRIARAVRRLEGEPPEMTAGKTARRPVGYDEWGPVTQEWGGPKPETRRPKDAKESARAFVAGGFDAQPINKSAKESAEVFEKARADQETAPDTGAPNEANRIDLNKAADRARLAATAEEAVRNVTRRAEVDRRLNRKQQSQKDALKTQAVLQGKRILGTLAARAKGNPGEVAGYGIMAATLGYAAGQQLNDKDKQLLFGAMALMGFPGKPKDGAHRGFEAEVVSRKTKTSNRPDLVPQKGTTAKQPWYRGEDARNTSGDKFYSSDKGVAGEFGKVSELDATQAPKNPLIVESKEVLAEQIGYRGDPMAEPKGATPRFDDLAKQHAQANGHDGIIYENGTFDARELHVFAPDLVPQKGTTAKQPWEMTKESGAVATDAETGKPFVSDAFHGTNSDFVGFDVSKQYKSPSGSQNLLGDAFYFTPTEARADSYASLNTKYRGGTPVTKRVRVSLKNPLVFESRDALPPMGVSSSTLRANGFDGIIIKQDGKVYEIAVLDAKNIETVGTKKQQSVPQKGTVVPETGTARGVSVGVRVKDSKMITPEMRVWLKKNGFPILGLGALAVGASLLSDEDKKHGGLGLAMLSPMMMRKMEKRIERGGPDARHLREAIKAQRMIDREPHFLKLNEAKRWLENNQEYIKSVDPDILCQRSEAADHAVHQIKAALGKDYSFQHAWAVFLRGRKAGLLAPCDQCYVFAARVKSGSAMQKPFMVGVGGYGGTRGLGLWELSKETLNTLSRRGLRAYSSTDFKPEHVPGLIAMLVDAKDLGIPIGAYAKEPGFAELFGNSGIYLNLSLAKDPQNSMDWKTAMRLRKKYPNVGTVYIGFSDAEILEALKNPNIDHVIPWHSSGQGLEQMRKLRDDPATNDYTQHQTERDSKTGKKAERQIHEWEHGGDLQKYLSLVEKHKLVKKFPQFYDALKAEGKEALYMKLIGPEYGKFGGEYPFKPPTMDVNYKIIPRLIAERRANIGRDRAAYAKIAKDIIAEQKKGTFKTPEVVATTAVAALALAAGSQMSDDDKKKGLGLAMAGAMMVPGGKRDRYRERLRERANARKRQVNLTHMDFTPEQRVKAEADVEKLRGRLEKIKGRKLTNEDVKKAAEESSVLKGAFDRADAEKISAQILATRRAFVALSKQEGVGTPLEMIKMVENIRGAAQLFGRGLQSFSIEADASLRGAKYELIDKFLKLGKKAEEIEAMMKDIDWDNPAAVQAFYREHFKPSVMEILDEYRYINLLSSPLTHITNAFSNAAQVFGLRPLTMAGAAGFDPLWNSGQRQHYFSQVPTYMRGALGSGVAAMGGFWDVMRGDNLISRPDVDKMPSGSKWTKWGMPVVRAMEAADVFFRTLAEGGERASLHELNRKNVKAGRAAVEKLPAGIEVDVKAIRESTGQEVTIKQDARTAIKEARESVDRYKKLWECLKA